ncbi:hypothetical protein F0U44_02540 [Nocardioides humilatus]|uniref:Uncharacterized protein n=1 Tax=Nocardioides humilatus TaxID=2607660 RepID=A0A5B1LNJ5_9ACTN|nr:hypothetical protein [Nocardioides humilatus]KAA1421209.1 hypothetical protein F0U44_02540 [Nocardioides humilatus]
MIRRALVAVVAIALLAGCDDTTDEPKADPGSSTSATGSASPSGSPSPIDPGPVVKCPKGIIEIDPALPDAVPEGATSVRLCAAAPGKVTQPLDALTTNVTAIVQAVNGQRLVKRGCADHQLPAYQLAFGYPDGTTFVVAGRFTYCAELLVGSARRARAKPALDRFVRVLLDQRQASSPPARAVDARDIGCEQPSPEWTSQLARPVDLIVAVLCYGDPEHPEQAHRLVIRPGDLEILVASMRKDRVSTYGALGCTYFQRNDYWIVGASAWGDPISMRRGCGDLAVAPNFDWDPRGEARRIRQDLIARAHR